MRRVPGSAIELLREQAEVWVSPEDRPLTTEELHEAVAGADAALTLLHDRVDGAFLDAAGTQLRVVANVAVGYDNIDVPAAEERGVVVTNTPGVLTDATADLAMALILAVTRRVCEGDRLVRAGGEWSWDMFFMLGASLQGKTLGVVGLGQIGFATARRARAFGMEIVYTKRTAADPELEAELGGARRLTLDELLAESDVVTIHVPLSDETRHLIDAGRLAAMRSSAYLVNTARGPVVDEAALAAALEAGEIAGAALDVFEHEPKVDPGLLPLDNVVLLPHLGSATVETRTAMAELAARNALAVLSGEPPLTPVSAV
jgi:glyoxylate reductase